MQAVEVNLVAPSDRADLIKILHQTAARKDLHVDDVSEEWIELGRDEAATSPDLNWNGSSYVVKPERLSAYSAEPQR